MYEKLIDECKSTLRGNLVSIIKFGTEGEPNNILIVTKKLDFRDLEKVKPIILKFAKKTNVVPIIFKVSGVIDTADVFPLELLDMKYPHEVMFGKDIINQVKFDKRHVRRQLEFELRSKLIHLRENYIRIKKPKELRSLIKSAVPTVMPLFYGLLFLKDIEPPTELDALFRSVQNKYNVDMSVFRTIRQDKFDNNRLPSLVKNLMNLLEKLISIVDKLKV